MCVWTIGRKVCSVSDTSDTISGGMSLCIKISRGQYIIVTVIIGGSS